MTVLIITAFILSGCEIPEGVLPAPIETLTTPQQQEPADPEPSGSVIMYAEGGNNTVGIDQSRQWAQKNEELTRQLAQLKEKNTELYDDNKRLRDRHKMMTEDLERTEKELTEANELLIEMRKELDGWKTNVLGFREEINHVHKEQLQALIKIMKLLGAEYVEQEN